MQEVKGSTPFISTEEIGTKFFCGSSSVGRASASQAEGRGFESRFPLKGVGRIRKESPNPPFLILDLYRESGCAQNGACGAYCVSVACV